jgi:hypothetical protein
MTQDEIIEMVKQTDLLGIIDSQYYENELWIPDVVEFAKMVAEHEREACANICETLELPEWPDKVRQPLAQAIRARGQA